MTPTQIAAGVTIVGAFLGGAWLGRMAANADRDAERAAHAREQTEYLSRNYVSRSAAEAQYAALVGRSTRTLQEVIRVPAEPLQCPPDTDVRDVVLPGLADKLRKLRDASGDPAGADVGPVQP